MIKKQEAQFSARLFAFFKKEADEITIPTVVVHRDSERSVIPCFEQTAMNDAVLDRLSVLHPQVRTFLSSSVTYYQLSSLIKDELGKTVWKVKAPAWAVPKLEKVLLGEGANRFFTSQITNISVSCFSTGIVVLCVDVEPRFELTNETAPTAGKMLLSTFSRTGSMFRGCKFETAALVRVFSTDAESESVNRRLAENKQPALIRGLCGEEVPLGEMIVGLIPQECAFLMGDRFVTSAFLRTAWDGAGPSFSCEDYVDLVRLSRGESDHYLPDPQVCRPGCNGIVNTFENVAFALSAEGISCWVKPTQDQQFLQDQFKHRYDTIYQQLQLLALHQKYALVDLAKRLDQAAPPIEVMRAFNTFAEDGDPKKIERTAQELRSLRSEVSNFYLRAFFQQPTTLTNHHEFYQALQNALGVSHLLQEVQLASTELEFLSGSLHERISRTQYQIQAADQGRQHSHLLREIGKLILEQERISRNEFLLTLVVEFVAIPYYLYNFLHHALNCSQGLSVFSSLTVTLTVMLYTLFKYIK